MTILAWIIIAPVALTLAYLFVRYAIPYFMAIVIVLLAAWGFFWALITVFESLL